MEGRTLLKGGAVFRGDGRVRAGQSVLIEGHLISKVAPEAELVPLPGDWVIECGGRLLRPGLVDCHAHLVNGLTCPISGADALASYVSRFERRLSLASTLSTAEIEALSAQAIANGLRRGVTLFVEHLLAPRDVGGALDAQARVAARLGARLLQSHASTSFLGEGQGLAQVEANARCVVERRSHPLARAALGFSDSFNAQDTLLEAVARHAAATDVGVHFHLCESEDDFSLTRGNWGTSLLERLATFRLLGPGNVAAFARAVGRTEAELLAKSRMTVALSPLSGAFEGERDETLEFLLAAGAQLCLGSAGAGTVWEQVPLAFAACVREARARRLLEPDAALASLMFGAPAEVCSAAFGSPSGVIEPGALADLVVCDTVPAVEDQGGQGLHLAMQVASAPVAWTLVHGRVVVREGQLIGADALELGREAARAQQAIWRRAA